MIPLDAPPGLPPWEVWGGILTGSAALLTVIVSAVLGLPKVIAEVRALREHSRAQGEALAVVRHELQPNSGGSLADAIRRIEQRVTQNSVEIAALRDDVSDVRAGMARHDRELGRANDGLAQLGARMTVAEQRSDSRHDRHEARLAHLEGR